MCGYRLSGLRLGVCAECGRELSVASLSRRPTARAAYALGSVGIGLSMVVHGAVLCMLLLVTTLGVEFLLLLMNVAIGAAIFGLCLFLTFWWDCQQSRLAQRTPGWRWAWAVALFVSPVWTSVLWIWIM